MASNRIKIIDYYDELKNKIDISAEELLSGKVTQLKKKIIESTRSKFIEQINQIQASNLEHLKESDQLFAPKCCFFLNQNANKNAKNVTLGKLIITNQYVEEHVVDGLNNDCEDFDSNKDKITFQIIKNLLKYSRADIIDLTNMEKNLIRHIQIVPVEPLLGDDLAIFRSWMDIKKLQWVQIRLDNETSFEAGLFKGLEGLKKLEIGALNGGQLEPGCFDGLTTLEHFTLNSSERQWKFDMREIRNFVNVKKLMIFGSRLSHFEPDVFHKLTSLESLSFDGCKTRWLKAGTFDKCESLKFINFYQTSFECIDNTVFNSLGKSLLHLNLYETGMSEFDLNNLNELKNLEFLDIRLSYQVEECEKKIANFNLPKLKYLATKCTSMPKFKQIKTLEILRVEGLRHFNQNDLLDQKNLIVLSIEKSPDEIKQVEKKEFNKLKNLVYLEIRSMICCLKFNKKEEAVFKSLVSDLMFYKTLPLWNGFIVSKFKTSKEMMAKANLSFSQAVKQNMLSEGALIWDF